MNDEPYDDLHLALAALSFRGCREIRVTTRLAQEIERDPMYRAWQAIRERAQRDWDRWFGTGEIPPAFRRPEPEPVDPHAEALALNEGARLARDAAVGPAHPGDLRGEASIAVCLMPEPVPARRPHREGLDCWCGPFASGATVVHLDDTVLPGQGWALPRAGLRLS